MSPKVSNSAVPMVSRIVFGVLVLVSILLMTIYAREGDDGILHGIQDGAQSIATPFGAVGAAGSAAFLGVGQGIEDLSADPTTLSALREQNEQLRAMAVQNEEYRQEAQRLQELLNLTDRYGVEGVTARVVGRSSDAWNQTVTIDVGSDSGVEVGMTVMGAAGVVGQVSSVNPQNSSVRLLTDPQSGAAAILQSSRAEGVVRGSLDGLLYLENISADTDVQAGDIVLTSGLGGSYVRGLLIGTVARVEGSPGDATRRILVAPNSTVSAMEEVTVIFQAAASQSTSATGATGTTKRVDADSTTDDDSAVTVTESPDVQSFEGQGELE